MNTALHMQLSQEIRLTLTGRLASRNWIQVEHTEQSASQDLGEFPQLSATADEKLSAESTI